MITFYFVGILFVAAILAFIGFCLYGLFTQKNTVKKARTVEASVRSCEQKILTEKDGNKFTYYLVTVDFYGLNGEMIEKTIKSQKKLSGRGYHSFAVSGRNRAALAGNEQCVNKQKQLEAFDAHRLFGIVFRCCTYCDFC